MGGGDESIQLLGVVAYYSTINGGVGGATKVSIGRFLGGTSSRPVAHRILGLVFQQRESLQRESLHRGLPPGQTNQLRAFLNYSTP